MVARPPNDESDGDAGENEEPAPNDPSTTGAASSGTPGEIEQPEPDDPPLTGTAAGAPPDDNDDPKPDDPARVGDRDDCTEPGQKLCGCSLVESLGDAGELVQYASREGLPVSDDVIDAIVETKLKYGTAHWDDAAEKAFWKAFRKLSEAMQPISIDSLRATLGQQDPSQPSAKRAVKIYTRWTIGFLVILILIQSYWIFGVNITSQIDSLEKVIVETGQKIFETSQDMIGHRISIDRQTILLGEAVDAPEAKVGGEIEQIKERKNAITKLESAYRGLVANKQFEERKQNDAMKTLNAEFVLLNNWNILAKIIFPIQIFGGISDFATADRDAIHPVRYEKTLKNEISREFAKFALKSMSSFLLPLLYGLLGAYAYILRTLMHDIRAVTFTEASAVRFRLRWPLGMLSGIAIGWFFDEESLPSGLSDLKPLALAFLAGYSVEMLFTGLDKIIAAFSDQGRRPAK